VTLNLPRLPALARAAAGVLMGGIVTGLVFLICVQGSFRQGITDFDFAHVLGTAIQGTAEERQGADALGIIGDTAGPTALYTTLIAGVCLLAVHALVVVRSVRARWFVQGLALAAVGFLAIGLIYVPYADANLDTPVGAWGSDWGAHTPLVLGLSILIASMVGARIYDLAVQATWWEQKSLQVDDQLAELTGVDESLELPEQGSEQGVMRP
jgi:hypothetical protein